MFYFPESKEEELEMRQQMDVHAYTANVGKPPIPGQRLLTKRKPTQWLIQDFGAGGALVLLAAESGIGKTSLMYQMPESITQGNDFAGQLMTNKAPVLIIQADESRRNSEDKVEIMGLELSEMHFIFAEDDESWATLNLERLERLMEVNRYGAVFFDIVTTLLTGGNRAMRDPEFAQPLYELNRLASQYESLFVISSHLRKPETGGQRNRVSIHDVMGASTQIGAVSDVWGLYEAVQPQFEDHYILECLGKRNCEKGLVWNLQGSAEDFSWQMASVGGSALLPLERQQLKQRVLGLLSDLNEGMSVKEIASGLGCNEEHCRRVCKELLLSKLIERQKLPKGNGRPIWLYRGFLTSIV